MSRRILMETAQPMKLGLYGRILFPSSSVIHIDRRGNPKTIH